MRVKGATPASSVLPTAKNDLATMLPATNECRESRRATRASPLQLPTFNSRGQWCGQQLLNGKFSGRLSSGRLANGSSHD